MSALLTPPSKSVTPPPMRPATLPTPLAPHRFTIAEYRKLYETGLYYDKKTMLIDGELYVMGMPDPPHNIGLSATEEYLRATFAGQPCYLRNQQGFDIGTANDPGPDLAIVAGKFRDYHAGNPSTAILIVEIADSSLAIDTGRKAELYAAAGVPDYWVLDVVGRELHVFRDPQSGGTYTQRTLLKESDSIAPLAAPAATVIVADLLPNP